MASPIDQPIPQLPALHSSWVQTADLQVLSSVTATLEYLVLVAPDIDSGQPYTLAHFTCLEKLDVDAQTIRNFKPEVLPPTLCDITLAYTGDHATLDEILAPANPVDGTIDRVMGIGDTTVTRYAGSIIRWTHNAQL